MLARFERAGLRLATCRLVHAERDLAGRHDTREDNVEWHGAAVRDALLGFLTEGQILAAVFEGRAAAPVARKLCGATNPQEAAAGTSHGDYGNASFAAVNAAGTAVRNLVHTS